MERPKGRSLAAVLAEKAGPERVFDGLGVFVAEIQPLPQVGQKGIGHIVPDFGGQRGNRLRREDAERAGVA